MIELAQKMGEKVNQGGRLWLFLDYDGTLAEFAPTPDDVFPDPDLIAIITRLAGNTDVLRVVILSGRRLAHIQKLLPVKGILLAGTYGVEFQTWEGELVNLIDFDTQRPFLDVVKKQWSAMIKDQAGFFLEDKGYSLAIHARDAEDKDARVVIADATLMAKDMVEPGTFHIQGGRKFLEVAPLIADKGQSVSLLLKRFAWPDADILYFGDDDKDEEAFKVIVRHGGTAVLVSSQPRPTTAQYRLNNPCEVRDWLAVLADYSAGLWINYKSN